MKSIDKKKLIREMWFFLIAGIVIGLDQLSKYLVRSNMLLRESIPEEGFFRFTYGTNTGGVFGFFSN